MKMNQLPLLGIVALLAACAGGADKTNTAGQTDSTNAAAAPATTAPATAPAPAAAPAAAPVAPASGNVVEVRMVTKPDGSSGTFEPANVTVKKGDTVRFVTDGKTVHNVDFAAAINPGKSGLPAASPYLTAPNQSYDLPVTMAAGTYNFQCDPHVALGMKGTLTVQ